MQLTDDGHIQEIGKEEGNRWASLALNYTEERQAYTVFNYTVKYGSVEPLEVIHRSEMNFALSTVEGTERFNERVSEFLDWYFAEWTDRER